MTAAVISLWFFWIQRHHIFIVSLHIALLYEENILSCSFSLTFLVKSRCYNGNQSVDIQHGSRLKRQHTACRKKFGKLAVLFKFY